MNAYLSYQATKEISGITIPGSKSESNRLLILNALFPNVSIKNCSNSDDTLSLIEGLKVEKGIVNIHHSGTSMRFLTSYFASKEGVEIILTGSSRMQERPIKELVDALKSLGADIKYINNEGYPPIQIKGKSLFKPTVNLKATISSQYISSLMLIAPSLPNGLTIVLEGEITSIPYIEMTLALLNTIGVKGEFNKNTIRIEHLNYAKTKRVTIESDWSSASYFYSVIALSEASETTLNDYFKNSLQGDSELSSIYKMLGVATIYDEANNSISLKKTNQTLPSHINIDLNRTPDIAQTIAVTCTGLGVSCQLSGLKTLKIKETDRLTALKTELEKLGAKVEINNESISVYPSKKINKDITINTYQDHRMAMAFAPLALKASLTINNPNVVTKSYKTFWEDLKKTGIYNQIK